MEAKRSHRMTPQLVTGMIIISLGMMFLLDHLGVLQAGDFLRYWPVVLILLGLVRISDITRGRRRFSGILIALIGLLLLLRNLDVISFRVWDYWPVIPVVIGSMIVFRALARRFHTDQQVVSGDAGSRVDAFVMFGGVSRKNASQEFIGGEITTIMGGCELDLREASIRNGEAIIDVFTFWGGIDIKVPEDWTVSVESTPLMGGCEDKTRPPRHASGKRLIVRGYVVMGGVEIGQ